MFCDTQSPTAGTGGGPPRSSRGPGETEFRWHTELVSAEKKEPPAGLYEPPAGYTKVPLDPNFGVLGRVQREHPVDLVGYIFASNHYQPDRGDCRGRAGEERRGAPSA